MNDDKTINQLLQEFDEKIAWFHGGDFSLDLAEAHFTELKKIADQLEKQLQEMKNKVEIMAKDFSE